MTGNTPLCSAPVAGGADADVVARTGLPTGLAPSTAGAQRQGRARPPTGASQRAAVCWNIFMMELVMTLGAWRLPAVDRSRGGRHVAVFWNAGHGSPRKSRSLFFLAPGAVLGQGSSTEGDAMTFGARRARRPHHDDEQVKSATRCGVSGPDSGRRSRRGPGLDWNWW